MHSTLKIETTLQRNASDRVVNELAVALDALDYRTRKERPD